MNMTTLAAALKFAGLVCPQRGALSGAAELLRRQTLAARLKTSDTALVVQLGGGEPIAVGTYIVRVMW
jgi:hypothetical protein